MNWLLEVQSGPGIWPNILLMGGVIGIFYFFLILPQQRRAKKEKEFRDSLKKGDSVVTIGGLHGKIVHLDEHTVLLEVDNNVKLKFDRTAIRLNDGK
jgi:preprotein translocase subunit YajC